MSFFYGAWLVTVLSMLLSGIKFKSIKRLPAKIKDLCMININAITIALPMLLYSVFRYGIGVDYYHYEHLFYSNNYDTFPIGYRLLCDFFKYYGLGFEWIIAVGALVLCWGVFYMTVKYSYIKYLSIFLFMSLCIYYETMSGFRQGIALGICLYSLKYLVNDKFINFFLCVVLAASFHYSAMIFLICYSVKFMNISVSKQISILLMFILVLSFLEPYLTNIVYLFGYENYFLSDYYSGDRNYYSLKFINVLTLVTFVIIYYLKRKHALHENVQSKMKKFIFIQILSTATIFIGGMVPEIHRIMYYFILPSVVSIPYFLNKIDNKKTKMSCCVMFMIITGVYCIGINEKLGYTALEYTSIFH